MYAGWLESLWQRLFPATKPGVRPYAVACRCGRVAQGLRQVEHQVLRCPTCSQPLFVLPQSVFRPPGWVAPEPVAVPLSPIWWLAGALVATALAMLLVYLVLRWTTASTPVRPTGPGLSPRQEMLDLLERGKRELDQGATHLARETLEQAIQRRDKDPKELTEVEHRRLNQLQRQATLLTDLAPVSLLVMLDQAERAPAPAAWQARFRREYLGTGLILDDVLRRDQDKRVLSVRLADLKAGMAHGRVALEDLLLVQHLPLQERQRWIVGARLKSIDREGGNLWIVRLEPESGVLFSERAALEAELPSLREEADWPLLLTRQQGLLDSLPAQKPHRQDSNKP